MLGQITQETLAKVTEGVLATMKDGSFKKAIDVSTGMVGYSLKQPAEQLVPIESPFRRTIPRRTIDFAEADHWKQITALGTPKGFAAERASGGRMSTALVPKTAAFKKIAVLGDVTLEVIRASQGFDPALAKETVNTLRKAMLLESVFFMGGNVTDVGVPAAPTVADRAGVGSINAGAGTTYYVRIVAMTLPAANRVSVDQPADYDGTDADLAGRAVAAVNPLRVDGTVTPITTGCGLSSISAEGNSGSLTGTGHGLKITWAAIPGAVAYAVFIGTATGAANLKCEAIVGQTSVTILSLVGTGLAGNATEIPAADETGDADGYDGVIASVIAGGGYVKAVNGVLTGTAGQGEILQVQDAFATIYGTAKIGKFRVVVPGCESRTLTRLGIVSNAMQIFATPGPEGRLRLTAGAHVGEIVNATTGDVCPVDVEPFLTPGTILILPTEIPYPDANVSQPFEWVGNADWMRFDYAAVPSSGPVYLFDTLCIGVLEPKFPAGCGVLYNIFKG